MRGQTSQVTFCPKIIWKNCPYLLLLVAFLRLDDDCFGVLHSKRKKQKWSNLLSAIVPLVRGNVGFPKPPSAG
jgi:hypothetical protein